MTIFNQQGVQIKELNGMYFLCGEDGGHQSTYLEIQISKEDAEKVMVDINYSTKLVIDYQNKLWGLV